VKVIATDALAAALCTNPHPVAFSNTQHRTFNTQKLSSNTHYPTLTTHHQPSTMVKTKFTSKQADNQFVTHWKSSLPGGPTPSNYQDHELHLFAFPHLLFGEKLLKLAEIYTNKQIDDKIVAAAVGDAADRKIITIAGIANRIRTALGARAREQGVTVAEVTEAFRATRKANGVPIRNARVSKAASDGRPKLTIRIRRSIKNDDKEADDGEDGQSDADDED
jgi:hypothetical protein